VTLLGQLSKTRNIGGVLKNDLSQIQILKFWGLWEDTASRHGLTCSFGPVWNQRSRFSSELVLIVRGLHLNAHWFLSLDDARRKIGARRAFYNEVRPHTALNWLSAGVRSETMQGEPTSR
jgi:transposase InsO family protein